MQEGEGEGFPREEVKHYKGGKKRLLTTGGGSCRASWDIMYESVERSGLKVRAWRSLDLTCRR